MYGASASRERPGWFFGLTGPQLSLLVLVPPSPPGWRWRSAGGHLLVLVPCLGRRRAALVCIPVRGWSAAQWIGVLARHLLGRSHGLDHSSRRPPPATDADDPGEADLPGVLAGIRIHDGPPMPGRSTRPAVIQNHAARTWAATARIVHPGIGMADDQHPHLMGAGLAELWRPPPPEARST